MPILSVGIGIVLVAMKWSYSVSSDYDAKQQKNHLCWKFSVKYDAKGAREMMYLLIASLVGTGIVGRDSNALHG